jgi:hypothetical protein
MKTPKILIIPLMAIFLIGIASAASITTSLFYDATTSDSLTISSGNSFGATVSADSLFESSMTVTVDVLDSHGNVVKNVLNAYTTDDSYSNDLTIGQEAYLDAGNYVIRATAAAASGQRAADYLYLNVVSIIPPTNHAPVITSNPQLQVDEGQIYSYRMTATDADGDALAYSLAQRPSWLSINPSTGLITGTAPQVNSDTSYEVIADVSDGKALVPQIFSILVIDTSGNGDVTPPVITVNSPSEGQTYGSNVPLDIMTNEAASSAAYSIDGGVPVFMTRILPAHFSNIIALADGLHSVVFYATDLSGNMGHNAPVNFIVNSAIPPVDTIPPVVTITSPADGATYDTTSITVIFTATDNVAAISCWPVLNGLVLPSVTCNVPFEILAFNGTNTLTIYAADASGNTGSQTVSFTVNTSQSSSNENNHKTKTVSDTEATKQYLSQFTPKTVTEEEETQALNPMAQSQASAVPYAWIWVIGAAIVILIAGSLIILLGRK